MVSLCAANDICLTRSRSCGLTRRLNFPPEFCRGIEHKYIVAKDKTPNRPRCRVATSRYAPPASHSPADWRMVERREWSRVEGREARASVEGGRRSVEGGRGSEEKLSVIGSTWLATGSSQRDKTPSPQPSPQGRGSCEAFSTHRFVKRHATRNRFISPAPAGGSRIAAMSQRYDILSVVVATTAICVNTRRAYARQQASL